jgi:hypothetical protein
VGCGSVNNPGHISDMDRLMVVGPMTTSATSGRLAQEAGRVHQHFMVPLIIDRRAGTGCPGQGLGQVQPGDPGRKGCLVRMTRNLRG